MSLPCLPCRSMLYRFCDDPAQLAAAAAAPADLLLFDLEDSVGAGRKDHARRQLLSLLAEAPFGNQLRLVRVNGTGTPWIEADLAAIARAGIHGIMLPKTESAAQLAQVLAALRAAGAPEGLALWVMIETPLGILRAEEIAAAPQVAGLAIGAGDLSRGLGGYRAGSLDRQPLVTALGLLLLAARAHGRMAIDSSFRDPADPAGFAEACRRSRELGFDGKAVTTEARALIANEAYAPSADEIDWARRAEAAAAAAPDGETAVLDGQLLEPGYLTVAERTLALAAAIDAAWPGARRLPKGRRP